MGDSKCTKLGAGFQPVRWSVGPKAKLGQTFRNQANRSRSSNFALTHLYLSLTNATFSANSTL